MKSFTSVCGVMYNTRFSAHYNVDQYSNDLESLSLYTHRSGSFIPVDIAGQFCCIGTRNTADLVASLDLLRNKRFCRRGKHDTALRKPFVICLAHFGQHILDGFLSRDTQLSITTPAMNVFPRPVGKATSVFWKRHFFAMLN